MIVHPLMEVQLCFACVLLMTFSAIDEIADNFGFAGHRKNGDFSIPMPTQTLQTSWNQARLKRISAENETARPEQEVLAGDFHESNYESEGPMHLGPNEKEN